MQLDISGQSIYLPRMPKRDKSRQNSFKFKHMKTKKNLNLDTKFGKKVIKKENQKLIKGGKVAEQQIPGDGVLACC